jgi:Spy/CpxP family protein refolding chaperone
MKRKSIIFIAIAMLISISMMAQRPQRGPARQGIQQFKSELNLTDEQEQQIKTLNEGFQAKVKALREAEGERSEKRTQMQTLRKEHQTAIQNVLTEEQKATLKSLREEAREERKDRRANFDKEGLRSELEAHRTNTVLPVLKSQRAKLEEQLSEEDKTSIEKLRTDLKPAERRMERGEGKGKGERGQPKGFTEEEKARHEQLRGLVEKYEEEIDALMEEIKPQARKWREETKAIQEKYRPEPAERPSQKMKRGSAMKGKKEGQRGQRAERSRRGEFRSMISKGRFLLMDPAADNAADLQVQPMNEIRSYPNPASNLNTLQYTIKQEGQIRIELRDRQGRVLKVLLDDQQEKGDYSLDVDISQLKNGVYYYTIIDAQGQRSEKLVISN